MVQETIHLFLSKCRARFHWGKAGWPRHFPCFDGATMYPDTWCNFGCAVQVGYTFSGFLPLTHLKGAKSQGLCKYT